MQQEAIVIGSCQDAGWLHFIDWNYILNLLYTYTWIDYMFASQPFHVIVNPKTLFDISPKLLNTEIRILYWVTAVISLVLFHIIWSHCCLLQTTLKLHMLSEGIKQSFCMSWIS